MKTNIDLLLNFIFTITFTVLIFAIVKINKDKKEMQTEINELRLVFNQKFLQEMAVNEPQLRVLSYRKIGHTKSINKFQF